MFNVQVVLCLSLVDADERIYLNCQDFCGLFIAERTYLFFGQPLGKGSITNRALKRKNPFSSVEGAAPQYNFLL